MNRIFTGNCRVAGLSVQSAQVGVDYRAEGGVIVPIRGNAPDKPAVPADAVTASGSVSPSM